MSLNGPRRMMMAGDEGGFNPLSLGWTHAYWAEGPEFVALGYADNAAIATIPDEIGTADFTQATGTKQALYKNAPTGLNGKPGFSPDGTDDTYSTTAITFAAPYSCVAINVARDAFTACYVWHSDHFADAALAIPNGNRTAHMMAGGNSRISTAAYSGESARISTCYYATSGVYEFDGVVTTGNAAYPITATKTVFLFAQAGTSNFMSRPLAFLGFASGDIRSDAKWAQFEAWVTTQYGITIA